MKTETGFDAGAPDIRHICADEIKLRGWKLATDPLLLAEGGPFEARVHQRVTVLCSEQRRAPDEQLVRRTVHTEYGCLLHKAVGLDGSYQQHVALDETMAYGWREALGICHNRELAQSATIWAANLLWRNIGRCKPESYFPYFLAILRTAAKMELRKARRVGQREIVDSDREPAPGAEEEGAEHDVVDTGAEEEILAALLDADRERLIRLLRDCLKNERRLHVLLGRIFRQLNVSEVAQQLRMTSAAVSREMNRALETIHKHCYELLIAELRALLAGS